MWANRTFLPNKISLTETSSHRPLQTNTAQYHKTRMGTAARTQALTVFSLTCPTGLCLWRAAGLGLCGTVAPGSLPLRKEDVSPTYFPPRLGLSHTVSVPHSGANVNSAWAASCPKGPFRSEQKET